MLLPQRDLNGLPRLRHGLAAAALSAIGGGLGGCTAPKITLGEARVASQDSEFVRVGIDVALANAATEPIPLLEWDYRVSTGAASYRGTWSALQSVPAGESVVVSIPAVLPATAVVPGESLRVEGSVSYRAPNRVFRLFEEFGFHRPTESFSGTAAVSVR